ncbi:MAG: DUF86 domain-containing protein [Alphaproteobacteria bacterium]|nr:DUF86 domain-containing protein [Alphaproteobacteria bacterium]
MAKTPTVYFDDILEAIRRIENYTRGMTRTAFERDEKTQDAVTRCLEIISEASRRIPDRLKSKRPDIPWSRIAGIGNILRHEYRSVSTDAIWEVTRSHLADLTEAIRHLAEESRKG